MSTKLDIKNTVVNFLVPIISMVSTLLLFVLVIFPSIKRLPELREEVQAQKELSEQLVKKTDSLNKLLDFKSVVDENAELVTGVLSPEAAVPELLTQVDTISRESGLDVTKLAYTFGDGIVSNLDIATESVFVTLGLEGNFEQLLAFLRNIENSARVVNVENVRYSVDTVDAGTKLGISITLSSPFLAVESNAVTDVPIAVDITSPDFLAFMGRIKELKFYRPTINENVVIQEGEVEEIPPAEEQNPIENGVSPEQIIEQVTGEQVIPNDNPEPAPETVTEP